MLIHRRGAYREPSQAGDAAPVRSCRPTVAVDNLFRPARLQGRGAAALGGASLRVSQAVFSPRRLRARRRSAKASWPLSNASCWTGSDGLAGGGRAAPPAGAPTFAASGDGRSGWVRSAGSGSGLGSGRAVQGHGASWWGLDFRGGGLAGVTIDEPPARPSWCRNGEPCSRRRKGVSPWPSGTKHGICLAPIWHPGDRLVVSRSPRHAP